jgi:hypothetical protein
MYQQQPASTITQNVPSQDVHIGNKTTTYCSDVTCAKTVTFNHMGQRHVDAALDFVKSQWKTPEKLLVTVHLKAWRVHMENLTMIVLSYTVCSRAAPLGLSQPESTALSYRSTTPIPVLVPTLLC